MSEEEILSFCLYRHSQFEQGQIFTEDLMNLLIASFVLTAAVHVLVKVMDVVITQKQGNPFHVGFLEIQDFLDIRKSLTWQDFLIICIWIQIVSKENHRQSGYFFVADIQNKRPCMSDIINIIGMSVICFIVTSFHSSSKSLSSFSRYSHLMPLRLSGSYHFRYSMM